MVIAVLLAMFPASSARIAACLDLSCCGRCADFRLAGEHKACGIADISAVQIATYAGPKVSHRLFSQTSVGATATAKGALETFSDTIRQFALVGNGLRVSL
jgi:hypothetical protein